MRYFYELLMVGTLIGQLLLVSNAFAYLNSTIICISNTTLQENWTVYKDGNQSNLTINTLCPSGECDNQTMQCAPPEYQQNLYRFGIIFAIGAAAILILRRI